MFTEHVQSSRAVQRDATRANVIATAERLFQTQGFAATTIRQIAADAGVSVGTVMAVGDKEALLIEIFDGWIAAVHRERSAGAAGDRPPKGQFAVPAVVDAVIDVFGPFIARFTADRALSREYAAVLVRGDRRSVVFDELAAALLAEIEAVLARSPIARDRTAPCARTIYFCYLGILMAVANGAVGETAAVDQLRETIHLLVTTQGVPA